MIEITLDGRKVKAQEGSTLLSHIRARNIDLPTLCQHDELSPFGACRLCAVEVKVNGKWELATACNTPVAQGMEVRTDSERAIAGRKLAASLLYYRYPATRAVRDLAEKLGIAVAAETADAKECVLCGLCTRTCREIVGVAALSFEDRGLGRDVDEPRIAFDANACIGCGSCTYVCPTGHVKMEATGDKRIIWDKAFKMATCQVCGRPFAPEDQLKYISTRAGVPMSRLKTCMSCR